MTENKANLNVMQIICIAVGIFVGMIFVKLVLGLGGILGSALGGGLGAAFGVGIYALIGSRKND